MDKLKPVLTHKFWILFVIVMVLAPFGWSSGTGALTDGIEGEKSKLEGTFKKIGGLAASAAEKNDTWIDELTKINSAMASRTSMAAASLWDSQKQLKVWPPRIARRAPVFHCLEDVATVVAAPNGNANVIRTFYKLDYERELDRVWLLVEPEQAPQGARKVRFARGDLPTPGRYPWPGIDPSIEEIYSAQEDLWLISSLLTAIREVNAGTVSIVDSHVKELQLIQLFRGTRLSAGTAGSSSDGGGAAAGGAAGGAPEAGGAGGGAAGAGPLPGQPTGVAAGVGGGGGAMGAMGGGGGQVADTQFTVPVDFSLTEEFSAVLVIGQKSQDGGGAMGASSPMGGAAGGPMGGASNPMGGEVPMGGASGPMGAGGPMGSSASGGDASGGNGSLNPLKYYCEDSDFARTRGFKLKLVVDHRKVPELLAALSRSPWPIEIIHVNQGPSDTILYRPSEVVASEGAAGGGNPMGGGGFGGTPMGAGGGTPMGAGGGFGGTPMGAGGGTPMGAGGGFGGTPMGGGGGTPMGGGFGGTPMGNGGGGASSANVGLQAPGGNGGGTPMGGFGGQGGAGFQSPAQAMPSTSGLLSNVNVVPTENPHLATVVVVGLMTLYKRPPVDPNATQGDASNMTTTPAANPGAAPAANPGAAPAANPGAAPAANPKPQG